MQISFPYRSNVIFKIGMISLIIAVSAIGFWGFKTESNGSKVPPEVIRPVKSIKVATSALSEKRSFPGLVEPLRETKMAFRVGGPLVELSADIGQHVEKGQVIARIDPRDFEINITRLKAVLRQAEANVKALKAGARSEDIARLEAQQAAARVQLKTAENDFIRQKNLLADKAASKVNYDNAQKAYEMARANMESITQELKKAKRGGRSEDVEAAEAGLKKLRTDLAAAKHAWEDSRLKAPYNGYISQKFVENFENVRPGEPIVSFIDLSNVKVHAVISEDVIIRINQVTGINCTLSAYPGRQFEATVKEIGRKSNSANQSYPLTVALKIPQELMVTPGMTATLSISLANGNVPDKGYLLPSQAIFSDPTGQSCVFRIDSEKMTVVKTPVTIGSPHHGKIQILSGLSEGDRVVTAGAKFLRENQKIRILDEAKNDVNRVKESLSKKL